VLDFRTRERQRDGELGDWRRRGGKLRVVEGEVVVSAFEATGHSRLTFEGSECCLGGRDGRKPSYANAPRAQSVNIFEMKGNVVGSEGVLGKETRPKIFTMVRMKSAPKHGVAFFCRQVASVNYGGTVTKKLPVVQQNVVHAIHSPSRGVLHIAAQLLFHDQVPRGGIAEDVDERLPKPRPVGERDPLSDLQSSHIAGQCINSLRVCQFSIVRSAFELFQEVFELVCASRKVGCVLRAWRWHRCRSDAWRVQVLFVVAIHSGGACKDEVG